MKKIKLLTTNDLVYVIFHKFVIISSLENHFMFS